MGRIVFAVALLLVLPLAARAQDSSPTAFAWSVGYVSPQDGIMFSAGLHHMLIGEGQVFVAPAISGDAILTHDPDSPFYRDTSNYCRDERDDEYVDDVLCTPDMSLAARGELWLTTSTEGTYWIGPGVRFAGGDVQPYGFVALGNELYAKAAAGPDLLLFELGFRFGI